MTPDTGPDKARKIRAGTLAFGVALLLRSDTAYDGIIIDLAEPDPEPDLGRGLGARSLPVPKLGKTTPQAAVPQRIPVPSLSETLLGPRVQAQPQGSGPKQFKARSQSGSALSGTFAGPPRPAPANERTVLPVPEFGQSVRPQAQLAQPAELASVTAQNAVPGVAGIAPAAPAPQPAASAISTESTLAQTTVSQTSVPQSTLPQPALAAPEPALAAPEEADQAPSVLAPTAIPAVVIASASVPEPAAAAPQPTEVAPLAESAPPALLEELPAQEAQASDDAPQAAPAPVQLAVNQTDLPPAFAAPTRTDQPAPALAAATPAPAPPAASVSLPVPQPVPNLTAVFAPPQSAPSAAPIAAPSPADGNGLALPGANGIAGSAGQDSVAGLTQTPNLQQIAGGAPPDLSDDDELILELRLSGGGLADTLVGYGTRNGIYLPLGALARTLDLAIVVSQDGTYASGWFLDEKRTLTIDLRQKQLELLGKSLPFPTGVFVARDGEMYVLADYLGELMPLSLKTDLRDQSVTITTREPFPFEARLAREQARERLGSQQSASLTEVFKREPTDYRLIDYPLIDVELRGMSDRLFGTRAETDVRLSTDLAFMNAQTYFSASSSEGVNAARIELGRRDPDGTLLGPLGATEFQIGDVATVALPIGLRGTAGRGAYISNASLTRASVFDKIDLRGELPDGYEVELYRNNVLIGSTRNAVNGRFEFLQVSVDFGLNVMRLVFYGPQGQRREEVRQIAVGDGRLAKGEFEYTFGMAQKDRNLLNVYGPLFNPQRDFGAWRLTGQMSYGLTKDVTGTLSVADFDTDLGHRWQVAAGLRTGIGGISARIDGALQGGDGKAVQVSLAGRVLGTSATLSHAEYGGQFIDEVRSFDAAFIRRASEVNLTGTLDFSLGKAARQLPYTLRLRRLEFADGRSQTDASLRGSARLGTMMVSNSLEYQHSSIPGLPDSSQLSGMFDLARLSGSRLDLRGGLGYRILPDFKPISAAIQADYAFDDRSLLNASIGHSFENSETFMGLSATRQFDKFSLSLDSNYSLKSKAYSVALRLGFSLGRNPISRQPFIDRPGLATSGAVAIRAYHDKDGNDRFGPPDKPLEGLTFFSGTQSKVTDRAGLALIGDLPGGTRSRLQVDQDSIQDIALAPKERGFEVVPRPGRIHVKDFAVVDVSEVTGTAVFDSGSGSKPVSGLRLELIGAEGKVAAETRSESDGYFFFEQVLPGTYAIRVQPDQAVRLGITIRQGGAITVKAGQAVPMLDLVVNEQ